MMLIQLIVIETILVVVAQLLLRHGAMQLQTETLGVSVVIEMVKSIWIMGGLALHGASFVLYVFILTKLRLNIFYPVATGASLLLISVLSVWLLKEKITGVQIAGLVIMMVGMTMVYMQKA